MNLLELPKVSILDINKLPAISCVYFVINIHGKPLYIGSTVNLRRRWFHQTHHRFDVAKQENAFIAWMCADKEGLVEREDQFIESMNPPWNGINRGGHRDGSGRKPGTHPDAAHRTRRMIMLSDEELEMAKTIGDGNISKGIRRALEVSRLAA